MPLNWNISEIKDELCWNKISDEQLAKEEKEKQENPNRTQIFSLTREEREDGVYEMKPEIYCLIFLSMNIGMDEITEKNYEKFFNRLDMFQRLNGSPLKRSVITDKGLETTEEYPYTLEMIKNFIGLKTNVTLYTKSQFIRNQTKRFDL
jgi:hypothetical protein